MVQEPLTKTKKIRYWLFMHPWCEEIQTSDREALEKYYKDLAQLAGNNDIGIDIYCIGLKRFHTSILQNLVLSNGGAVIMQKEIGVELSQNIKLGLHRSQHSLIFAHQSRLWKEGNIDCAMLRNSCCNSLNWIHPSRRKSIRYSHNNSRLIPLGIQQPSGWVQFNRGIATLCFMSLKMILLTIIYSFNLP